MSKINVRHLGKRGMWSLDLCWTSWTFGVWWLRKKRWIGPRPAGTRDVKMVATSGGFDIGPLSLTFRR